MEEGGDPAHRTVAAAAAIMADLGFERREHIVTADFKRYREAQGEELERLRASNKKGTAEWKMAQRNKSAINAWSNMWQDVENPDLEEGEIPEFSGQSHRLRVRLELHGNDPEVFFGKRSKEAQGNFPPSNNATTAVKSTGHRRPQFELPKLVGPKDKSAVILSGLQQPSRPQSIVSSQGKSQISQKENMKPQKGKSVPMLGGHKVISQQKVQKTPSARKIVTRSVTAKAARDSDDNSSNRLPRTAYGGNLTSGNDFLATAQSLFQGKPNDRNIKEVSKASQDLSQVKPPKPEHPTPTEQEDGAKKPVAIIDDLANMTTEQLTERKQKLVDGLYGVQTLLGLRPEDVHMQTMVADIEQELKKVQEALTVLTTPPKVSLPKIKITPLRTKKDKTGSDGLKAQISEKKLPVLVLRPDTSNSLGTDSIKEQTQVKKQPTLILEPSAAAPVQKVEPTRKPTLRQIGITGDLASSIHALVGEHFAPEPEEIPTGARIGPHNLPNRNPSALKKLKVGSADSEQVSVTKDKQTSVAPEPKAIELVDPTYFLTKSLERFHLRSPDRSPPKRSAQLVMSQAPVQSLEADQPRPAFVEPAKLSIATTKPTDTSPAVPSPPSSRKSLLIRGCYSFSEIDRLFGGLKMVSVRVLGSRRFSMQFSSHEEAQKGFTRSVDASQTDGFPSPIVSWDDAYHHAQEQLSSDTMQQSGGRWLVQGIETLQGVLEIIPPETERAIASVTSLAPSKHIVRFIECESSISALNRLPPQWLRPPRSLDSELPHPYVSWLAPEKPDETFGEAQDDLMLLDKPMHMEPKFAVKEKEPEVEANVFPIESFEDKSYWAPGRSYAQPKSETPKNLQPTMGSDVGEFKATPLQFLGGPSREPPRMTESQASQHSKASGDPMQLDKEATPSQLLEREFTMLPPRSEPQASQPPQDKGAAKPVGKKPLLGAKSRWAPPSPESKPAQSLEDNDGAPPHMQRPDTDPGWNKTFAKYKRPTQHELPAWLQQVTQGQSKDHGAAVRRQYGQD